MLAKYLADEVLPSTDVRITCYFFFKDNFEDQRSSITALCCILRQIFMQHPASFSDRTLELFERGGERLLTSFHDLWDILISVAASYKKHEVICILEALDECADLERNQLIGAVSSQATLEEMAIALAIEPNHRSLSNLELWPETRFHHEVRDLCGLFVVVVDSRIYLLYQTARDFLDHQILPPVPVSPSSSRKTLRWKFSLYPKESNRILAEICILRLSLSDFSLRGLHKSREREQDIAIRTFLGYAA